MSWSRADPGGALAARYDQAREALHSGDLERVAELLGGAELPLREDEALDPATWRAVHDAHTRLHDALRDSLDSTRAELAKLRQGRRAVGRMGPRG